MRHNFIFTECQADPGVAYTLDRGQAEEIHCPVSGYIEPNGANQVIWFLGDDMIVQRSGMRDAGRSIVREDGLKVSILKLESATDRNTGLYKCIWGSTTKMAYIRVAGGGSGESSIVVINGGTIMSNK